MYYTLRFERALKHNGALSKLEAACIEASFDEMRNEGYADDGLFPAMSEFFLPLTISEQELKMTRSGFGSQARQNHLEEHTREIDRLERLANEATMHRRDIEERITNLNETIQQTYVAYLDDRLNVNRENTPRQQAKELQQIDQQWQYNRTQFDEQLRSSKSIMHQWTKRIADLEKQIDEHNTQRSNIRTESNQPQRPVDQGLVKPSRGFIMYEPPGMQLFLKFPIEKA